MPRHLVCVSFDFDTMYGLIARGLTTSNFVSRGEFGAVAVPRILALLRKYGIKATFFIPGFTIESYPAQSAAIVEAGHEIGHHGWTHLPPNDMSREQEEDGLVRANERIKRLSGKNARGYRSPSWDLSPNSMELLLKHGFLYDSSMMADDYTPYRIRQGDVVEMDKPVRFGKPSRLIEMPIAWSLDDFPHFEFLRRIRNCLLHRRFHGPVDQTGDPAPASCGNGQLAALVPLDAEASAALPGGAHGPARPRQFAEAGTRAAVLP